MKRVVFVVLLIFTVFLKPLPLVFSENYHFYSVDGQPLPQYESIYNELLKYFQDSVPEKITVIYKTREASRFNYIKENVLINESALKNDPLGIVGHESCHLCMENHTKGASVREEFRFFDEGFAEIFQSMINNKYEDYKNEAFAVAAVQNLKGNISFAKVQKWSEYFGNPQVKTKFYAYQVGASFNFFLIDRYGVDLLFAFFKDIGKTANLEDSFKNVFQKDSQSIENDWLGYLNKIKVSTAQPRIIKLFPENEATDVSVKIEQIYIEFDIPMRKMISIVTNCDSGVCYQNAYWKTDKILAVKVDLLPNYQYQILIGNPVGYRLMSKEGTELPITRWSFKTGSE